METASSIREAIRPRDWATSVDLTDAYFHITIHPRDRHWLRFVWKDDVFQFRALPFGLSLSPWIFTRVVREFLIVVRRQGIRIHAYLDDWLILNQLESLCQVHTQRVLAAAQDLGFHVNLEKSDLVPAQEFLFLGMLINTRSGLVKPAPARVAKLFKILSDLEGKSAASARQLASLLGSMESLAPLVALGRTHKRPLQRELKRRWDQTVDSWDQQIPLGDWFEESVSQWRQAEWLQQGVPLVPPPHQETLFTDASESGWGAHAAHLSACGLWSPAERCLHINLLEMEAVRLALIRFETLLSHKTVLLMTDNTTVMWYVKKEGGRGQIRYP
jgi:hypothetical protein